MQCSGRFQLRFRTSGSRLGAANCQPLDAIQIDMKKLTNIIELVLNILIFFIILLLISYISSAGWESLQFTRGIFIVLGVFITFLLIMLVRGIYKKKKSKSLDQFDFEETLLLQSIFIGNSTDGVELKTVHHGCDFLNRSYIELVKLNKATAKLLSIGMILFRDKRYYLTEKFHQYFDEAMRIENNPWEQGKIIHKILNTLRFDQIIISKNEYFTLEEYELALNEYISSMSHFEDA